MGNSTLVELKNSGTCCIVDLDAFGGNANPPQTKQVGSMFENHLNIKDNPGPLILGQKILGKTLFLEIFF